MSKVQPLYLGGAGQAAVMSEFLARGYNVAVPEIDRGDDLFVVQDEKGDFWRIQVKTATAMPMTKAGYSAQFKISRAQLETPRSPDLFYVLVVRHDDRWSDFVVIPRAELLDLHDTHGVGSPLPKGKEIVFKLSFRETDVTGRRQSLQAWRNNFTAWPSLPH